MIHSKSTFNTKLPIKTTEKKPEPPRSRTPVREDYNTNNKNDRSRTPVPEKTNLNLKLNRTEKNLINDLKNPKTPTRTIIEKSDKTPVKTSDKKDTKTLSTLSIPQSKNLQSKSPLNDKKIVNDKKATITKITENTNKHKEESKVEERRNSAKKTINKDDKKDLTIKNTQGIKNKDDRKESLIKNTSKAPEIKTNVEEKEEKKVLNDNSSTTNSQEKENLQLFLFLN